MTDCQKIARNVLTLGFFLTAFIVQAVVSNAIAAGSEMSPPVDSNSSAAASNEPPTTPSSSLSRSDAVETASFWNILAFGALLPDVKTVGKVVGSKDPKIMLGKGDRIYLLMDDAAAPLSRKYAVLRDLKKVHHPITGEYLGHLVQFVGMVETIRMEEDKVVATVTLSGDVIQRDDLIVSTESLSKTEHTAAPSLPLEGIIVEAKSRLENAQLDVVYIDRGQKDNIAAGDHFEIIHQAPQTRFQTRTDLPRHRAGVLIILSTQDKTSTARIVESYEPIKKGDLISYLPLIK